MSHRHDRVADLTLDLRFRHPVELFGGRSLRPAAVWRPGATHHGELPRHPGGENLDEAPGLDTRWHGLVRLDHPRQGIDARLAVEGGIEGLVVEEAPAPVAELLRE